MISLGSSLWTVEVDSPGCVPSQSLCTPSLLAGGVGWEAEKVWMLCKHCSVIAKASLCYQHFCVSQVQNRAPYEQLWRKWTLPQNLQTSTSTHLFLSLMRAANGISSSRSHKHQLTVLISWFLTKQLYPLCCLRQGDHSGQGIEDSFPVLCSGPRLQVWIWALPNWPDSQQQRAVAAEEKDTEEVAPSFKLGILSPGLGSCWKSTLVMSAGCEGPLLCLTTFLKRCFCLRRVTAFVNMECPTLISSAPLLYLLAFKKNFAVHFWAESY